MGPEGGADHPVFHVRKTYGSDDIRTKPESSYGINVPVVAVAATALVSVLMLFAAEGRDRPWAPRKPPVKPPCAHELTTPSRWPAEPPTPAKIDPARFREAFAYLCGRAATEVPADLLLATSRDAGVDPFLVAALVRERSHCSARKAVRQGYGLLGLQPSLYLSADAPLTVDRDQLRPRALLSAENNLRIGTQLLRMWMDAHPMLDETFGGVPHRSGVAHFLWGDQVVNSGGEDAVFTARRRILARYDGAPDEPQATSIGVPMVSPLEGVPRVASSGPGDDRDGGLRRHRGLDIAASEGEPVHAVGDGVVIFAGANLPGSPRHAIRPEKIGRYRNRHFATGGIYLCIRHDLIPGGSASEVVTCYMHLQSYDVGAGDRVSAGQVVGYVGHTGVYSSPPHLHFEVRVDEQAKNPLRYLSDLVIPPKATKTYYHVLAAKRARIRAARAAGPRSTGI
jgi:murein DD-endopeptidase MepM/ murein hydrolase activator NlpD